MDIQLRKSSQQLHGGKHNPCAQLSKSAVCIAGLTIAMVASRTFHSDSRIDRSYDLLIGVALGLVISLAFILSSNLRRPLHRIVERHWGGDVLRVELANQVSVLNRAALDIRSTAS